MTAVPSDILARLAAARALLMDAQFKLDYRGLECAALDDLQADAAALLSQWQGRPGIVVSTRKLDDGLPTYFAKAAAEYRRQRGRSQRRAA